MNHPADNRVVLLTPEGRGAVASLCVEGPRAVELVERHFEGSKSPLTPGRIRVGRWGNSIPEEIVLCLLGPQRIEVHCHGGAAASRRIIADLALDGCSAISWRDWIGSRETHPIRAAARAQLAEARTERVATILLDQYNGALDRAMDEIIAALTSDDAAAAAAMLDALLCRAAVGLHLVDPWRVVLAGPTNVGKSSLINALVGYRRSIVHDSPGTTRDLVNAVTALDGWPVEFTDTAGLRSSDDPLETAGIDRARRHLVSNDAVLLVFDAARAWTPEMTAMVNEFPAAIIVHNKMDLTNLNAGDPHAKSVERPSGMRTSALTGDGIQALMARIVRHLIRDEPAAGVAVPFTASQIAMLRDAQENIDRGDMPAAIAALTARRDRI